MHSDLESLIRRSREKQKLLKVAAVVLTIAAILAGASLVFLIFVSHDELGAEQKNRIADCERRGVKYFREIGSYPRLKTAPNAGRLATEVVEERCRRSLFAFPE